MSINKVFGYARVSSKEQNLDRQIEALLSYGVSERDIITDKASGKDFDRVGYQGLKRQLRIGDTLVIKELDRLGRDMEQIKAEWRELQAMGVDIVVIDNPILNTANKSDLEKTLISNIVFELLSYMAEKERVKIKTRQAEGIAQAKARGKQLGRPAVDLPTNWGMLHTEWRNGAITAKKFMDSVGMTRATFYRKVKEYEEEQGIQIKM